jgi:hypothetical protein
MDPDPLGLALGLPLPAAVAELSHQLLLLGVDADGRLPAVEELGRQVVEVTELGVAISVRRPLLLLGRRLQRVPQTLEEPPHRVIRHPIAEADQLLGQPRCRLRRPPQQRSRRAPRRRLHQRIEIIEDPRLGALLSS